MAQEIAPKAKIIEQYGPYGSQERPTFNFILEQGDQIKNLFIESGDVVDSLGFEVVDKAGKTKTIWSDGRVTGKHNANVSGTRAAHESTKLDLNGERITQIAGFEGIYQGVRHVVQLRIVTNVNRNGYGPYGRKQGSDIKAFNSPVVGPIVGFFGAQKQYLHSLGVSIEK